MVATSEKDHMVSGGHSTDEDGDMEMGEVSRDARVTADEDAGGDEVENDAMDMAPDGKGGINKASETEYDGVGDGVRKGRVRRRGESSG
jgi:hypothetical protein